MFLLYNISIHLYLLFIRFAALFNNKASLWVKGRKNVFERISKEINGAEKIIWFHAASLGEFEQGRPVIESFKGKYPNYKILLTFFSPSGYEIRKGFKGANYIYYLPIDTIKNAEKFVRIINPEFAIFIKYEFWYNYLHRLYKKNIPAFFISTIFRKEQYFFKWYGRWFRRRLKKINYFFVQNKESMQLLNSIGIKDAVVSGDTRFDRVYAIKKQVKQFPLIKNFICGKKVFLAGSTWQPCEEVIKQFITNFGADIKFIIAPHEVHKVRINSIISMLKNFEVLKYSEANENNIQNANVLVIDSIGILSNLYQYCDVAYIGGGFGKGIHNIQEAITFGKPVIFGPNYQKFKEANDLIKLKGVFSIKNDIEFNSIVNHLFQDKELYKSSSYTCQNYVEENTGATDIIFSRISELVDI